jgi:twitching motility protein PilJ
MNQSFFKTINSNVLLGTLIGVLLLSFVLMVGVFYLVSIDAKHDEAYLNYATQLRLLEQQISQRASHAANGIDEAFSETENHQKKFKQYLNLVSEGDVATGMAGSSVATEEALKKLKTSWRVIDDAISQLLQTRKAVTHLYDQKADITDIMTEVLIQAEAMLTTLQEAQATQRQIYYATRLLMILERISNNIRLAFEGDNNAITAEGQIGDDISYFGDVLAALKTGNAELGLTALDNVNAVTAVDSLAQLFDEKIASIDAFLDQSEQLFQAKDAANIILENNPVLLDNIEQLYNDYLHASEQRFISVSLGYSLAIFVGILLVLLSIVTTKVNHARAEESRARLKESQESNRRNQEAILRLLSEIADLADGDLTVTATVTEDFTGAIADALNYSIEALRDLVTSINSTAEQVTASAQTTRHTATQLTEASERQAQQIAKAGQAIIGMANSVKKVSANAIESADVAKSSVDIASKGARSVQDTIAGMDMIREQIQETSKRIKRLGESSQEIGEIVSLIEDIAEQTNILALNASIQAAMAGEAGRGFAVVAEEVQRLAERSGNATKQIDALVKTIQGDTNEAVSSMEQSTANVVSGAKLAEAAGKALIEIENVSVKLAGQIENISQTSRTQAAVASNIAGTMTIIQEITTQTSAGTNETATSIDRLAHLANELKKSVAGFTLPSETGKIATTATSGDFIDDL